MGSPAEIQSEGFVENAWQPLFSIREVLMHLVNNYILKVSRQAPNAASPEEGGHLWSHPFDDASPVSSVRELWAHAARG